MSAEAIRSGGLLVMDPSDKLVINVDWDQEGLPDGVLIDSNTFTITVIRQTGLTALTKDNPVILTGSRIVQVRLLATTATLGDKYEVSSTIVTNESPAQTIERSFTVLIQNQ